MVIFHSYLSLLEGKADMFHFCQFYSHFWLMHIIDWDPTSFQPHPIRSISIDDFPNLVATVSAYIDSQSIILSQPTYNAPLKSVFQPSLNPHFRFSADVALMRHGEITWLGWLWMFRWKLAGPTKLALRMISITFVIPWITKNRVYTMLLLFLRWLRSRIF